MKYYYLKMDKGNKLAATWFKGKNPLKAPAAVILFGKMKVEDILGGDRTGFKNEETFGQAYAFCNAGIPEIRENIRMLTIDNDGNLWITKPAGNVKNVGERGKDE